MTLPEITRECVDRPAVIEHDAVLDGPTVSVAVARLMSGEVFTGLMVDETERRAAALGSVLQTVVDEHTRLAWIGNPLRAPLTIERFLLQIVGPEIDLRVERGAAELATLIARRDNAETRLLIVVQQPETIDPQTLEQLGALARHLGEATVQTQFLFVGSSALRLPKMAHADIHQRQRLPVEPPEEPVSSAPRRRDVLPLILLLLVSCLGVVILLAPPEQHVTIEPHPVRTAVATPDPNDIALLRREFGTFLDEQGNSLPPLSTAQKDTLFNQFLTHHRRE